MPATSKEAVAAIAQRRKLNRIIEKAELEILYLKSNNRPFKNVSLSSKYESSGKKQVSWALYGDASVIGCKEDWHKSFLEFCNKTRNIYGSKVDRRHLLEYSNDHRGRGSSSDESVETAPNK